MGSTLGQPMKTGLIIQRFSRGHFAPVAIRVAIRVQVSCWVIGFAPVAAGVGPPQAAAQVCQYFRDNNVGNATILLRASTLNLARHISNS